VSLGYIGHCQKDSEDESAVFYTYSGADWNDASRDRAAEKAYDGTFAIDKSVLQWKPSKPRKQTEFLDWAYSAIENSQVVIIVECKNSFRRYKGLDIDYIALRLLCSIFQHLHKTGTLPESMSFIQ
jgi:hypothetical protein